jgi:hypothetical protein
VAETATGEHFQELVDWVEAQRPAPMVARAYLQVGDGDGTEFPFSSGSSDAVKDLKATP